MGAAHLFFVVTGKRTIVPFRAEGALAGSANGARQGTMSLCASRERLNSGCGRASGRNGRGGGFKRGALGAIQAFWGTLRHLGVRGACDTYAQMRQ